MTRRSLATALWRAEKSSQPNSIAYAETYESEPTEYRRVCEAQVDAILREWLPAALAEEAVILAAARAVHGNTIGDPSRGEPMVRVERSAADMVADATAALTAAVAALTEDQP